MVLGSCPVLSPFLGCLSGSSELDWGSVELLRTYKVRFSVSGCTLHPGLCLGCALWVFHAMSFSGSLSRSGGGVSFAFVTGFVAKTSAPLLLLGLRASLCRPNQRETIAMGDCYILCGRSGVTWSAWAAHRRRCERFLFAAGCSVKELSKTTVSFWLRMPFSRVCWLSVMEWSVLCPLSSVRSCCRSVSSLRRTLLSSWWRGEGVALALFLARLLIRGSCPSVPHNLPPVLCGRGAGPSLSRVCSPRLIITYDLECSSGQASSFVLLSSAAFPWDVTVGGSCMSPHFELLSVLLTGNIGLHFFRISRSFLSNV